MAVRVEGLRELGEAMNKLGKKMSQKIARKAVSAGARIIRNEAKARAPVDTGLLKQNIVMKKFRSNGSSDVRYGVGLVKARAVYANNKTNRRKGRAGKSYWQDGKAFYGHMVEFGTRKMRARPFLRPAFESQKERALKTIQQTIKEELNKT